MGGVLILGSYVSELLYIHSKVSAPSWYSVASTKLVQQLMIVDDRRVIVRPPILPPLQSNLTPRRWAPQTSTTAAKKVTETQRSRSS